ncbi:MAG: ATP-binding cassette domain-containing protein [Hyphomicrobiaceae bacterium]|nr:MAG: ATP-binding cassette domain-containing protein [Hyphomicrobiaceae bacterium]
MLAVKDLKVDIGGSEILRGVSLDVGAGELVCLVGRNGAGKSTTFRTIMGQHPARSGSIKLAGREIRGLRPFEIARLGIGFAPEESEVFGDLTVAENVSLPIWTRQTERAAAEREALAYRVFPNLQLFWQGEALNVGQAISLRQVAFLSLYSFLFITAMVALAIALFQEREVG